MNVFIKKQIFSTKNCIKTIRIVKIVKNDKKLMQILHYFQSVSMNNNFSCLYESKTE